VTAFRLFLHVLSASVWVGGMIVMAGTVPTSRHLGGNAGSTIATAFNRIMWPAFAVAVVTGLWNVMAIPMQDLPHPWIELHVLAVVMTGLAAAGHAFAGSNRMLANSSLVAATVFGVAAMYLGIAVTTALPG